jgi:hypothetical protein
VLDFLGFPWILSTIITLTKVPQPVDRPGQAGAIFSISQITSAVEEILAEWAEERIRLFELGPDEWERRILSGRIAHRLAEIDQPQR